MQKMLRKIEGLGISVEEKCDLSRHSSFHIGGISPAVFPKSREQMLAVLQMLSESKTRFAVMGYASNVVFSDQGFDGILVFTGRMNNAVWQENMLTVDAGASLRSVALAAQDRSLTGAEFAYGVPGTVGGAVFMNAGAFGQEMANICVKSEYFDTRSGTLGLLVGTEQGFATRSSIYAEHPEFVILNATLQLGPGDRAEIDARIADQTERRKRTQPLEYPSAGSVFKRPEGDFAGRLIEASSLKGVCVGDACVSEKHAGFIINKGKATAADVRALVDLIRERVLDQTGVLLECEIRFIG